MGFHVPLPLAARVCGSWIMDQPSRYVAVDDASPISQGLGGAAELWAGPAGARLPRGQSTPRPRHRRLGLPSRLRRRAPPATARPRERPKPWRWQTFGVARSRSGAGRTRSANDPLTKFNRPGGADGFFECRFELNLFGVYYQSLKI